MKLILEGWIKNSTVDKNVKYVLEEDVLIAIVKRKIEDDYNEGTKFTDVSFKIDV